MLQNLDRVKETFSAVLMISQEDGERVEIQAFERIVQIEEGSIKKENFLKANHSRLTKRHRHRCLVFTRH